MKVIPFYKVRGVASRPVGISVVGLEIKYFVYIIQSQMDDSWYYGFSEDVEKRLIYHNFGMSKYTKRKIPWKLIFTRVFMEKREALSFEKKLKKLRNKGYIKREYAKYFL